MKVVQIARSMLYAALWIAGIYVLLQVIGLAVDLAIDISQHLTWSRVLMGVAGFVLVSLLLNELFRYHETRIGMRTSLDLMERWIRNAMWGGYDNHRVRLRVPASGQAVEFIKSDPKGGPTRFFMRVLEKDCHKRNVGRVRSVLREHGIPCDTEKDASGMDVIVVECALDLDMAVEAARAVLNEVYGVTTVSRLRALRFGPCKDWKGAVQGWDNVLRAPEVSEDANATRKHNRT